jgi:hypothetical protein
VSFVPHLVSFVVKGFYFKFLITPFLISPKGEKFRRSFPPGGRQGRGFTF